MSNLVGKFEMFWPLSLGSEMLSPLEATASEARNHLSFILDCWELQHNFRGALLKLLFGPAGAGGFPSDEGLDELPRAVVIPSHGQGPNPEACQFQSHCAATPILRVWFRGPSTPFLPTVLSI